MNFKQYKKIWKIWAIVMVVLCFVGYFITPLRFILSIIMLSLIILGFVFYLIYGRCPSCGKLIYFNRLFYVKNCPFCSKSLYDEHIN